MHASRAFAVVLCLGAALAAGASIAHACACCSHQGQRYVGVAKLDPTMRDQIDRLRFVAEAELFVGERDTGDVKGITRPSTRYELHVSQDAQRWTFAFRDKPGNSGTLSLALPDTVSILSVDPRLDEREGTTGPALYKEWKLTSAVTGTGVFAPSLGKGQRITLILQGHGNNCTSADMATHWTLVVFGPKAQYHLFGKFVQ